MNRKHFEALAEGLRSGFTQTQLNYNDARVITEAVARAVQDFNPWFDEYKFLSAALKRDEEETEENDDVPF